VAISGPAGFLGSRVVDNILDVHEHRQAAGLEPGELLLLSSSPGHLMERLTRKYGAERMKTVRRGFHSDSEAASWRPSRCAALPRALVRWWHAHRPATTHAGAVLCRGIIAVPHDSATRVCAAVLTALRAEQHTHAACQLLSSASAHRARSVPRC
jgi:hypothetical protein